ncbi:hypothetical protein [Hoeflea prorocentri]|uniref:Aminoglycoside phosphotransferase n=1 Tax=Hoeflea prorocentri TaxID=1922333 RepID=A0A9X3UFH1_9HYPH|nr:hypothetical protein [Hoeflea prorocentri]MCY6379930.1 hypothetical protein [Hoeflea prorocentri]MDA5397730.1 hypothetical protein [Hoeflea prorocentri]
MPKSFFRSAFNRIAAAREVEARRYVGGALLSLDDETLNSLGFTREELRRNAKSPFPF